MIGSLLLLAASALDLGTSPLAPPDHAHRWVEIQNDEEGMGWIDQAWRAEAEVNGRSLQLVLMRGDIRIEEPMTGDFVLAVDCQRDLLGVFKVWVHQSSFLNNAELPVDVLTMDFAETPPSVDERKIIDFACDAGPTAK